MEKLWLVILILVLFAIWIYARCKRMSVLRRNRIPGQKPHLIFGNLFDMETLTPIEKQNRLIEKYGKIAGFYNGANPHILVADPQLAKNILIKDFDNFSNRTTYWKYVHPSVVNDSNIVNARKERWEKIRRLLTPSFSAFKLRKMTPIIDDIINTFIEIVAEKSASNEDINICKLFHRLSLENIIKTAFGVRIDAQNNPNQFILSVEKNMDTIINKTLFRLSVCFPEIYPIIQFMRALHEFICHSFKYLSY